MVRRGPLNLTGCSILSLVCVSDAFLTQCRPGGPSTLQSPIAPQPRISVALGSSKTNVTTDYAIDEAQFLSEIEQQLSDLQSFHQESTALSHVPTESRLAPNDALNSEKKDEGMFSELWKARMLLIGAAALYGTNFSLVKLLGDNLPVGVSSTLRFGLAAAATLPWLVGKSNEEGALMAAWLGFEVGLWTSIGYVAQAVGLETTPASESAFICSLAVVTVPLLDWMTGKKLLTKQWIGVVLAVLGVAFLELADVSTTSMTMGDMLSLIQPFAFGMGFWRMESAMQRFPEEAPRMTAAQLFAVFLSSLAYGLWTIDASTLQSMPWVEWLTSYDLLFSLFWTGIVTTALTIYMETLAMKTLSAAETTLIFSTEPLWGTAFAALVMGEELGMNVALGAAFILTACIYSNLGMEGIQKLLKGGESLDTSSEKPLRVNDLPASLRGQWLWFTSGLTANWATWTSITRNMPAALEELQDGVEDVLINIIQSIL